MKTSPSLAKKNAPFLSVILIESFGRGVFVKINRHTP